MGRKIQKYPTIQERGEQVIKKAQTRFYGMYSGTPASEIDDVHSALNINIIDYGDWAQIRTGSKRYSEISYANAISSVNDGTDVMTMTVEHPWTTGQSVWIDTTGTVPAGLAVDTEYYVIRDGDTTLQLATTYANAIAGTAIDLTAVAGTGVNKIYYGEINAVEVHESKKLIVWMFGNRVYVSGMQIDMFTEVNLIGTVYPTGVSMMDTQDQHVILNSTNGIFRIVLDYDYYYMEKVNGSIPTTIITDINEDVDNDLTYGYHVIYSWAHIEGTGLRSRITDDAEMICESATSNPDDAEKDFGEVFYDTEINSDETDDHVYGDMTLPDDVFNATHFPVYRTKNISESSGGVSETVDGIGNRPDILIWSDDVPVAKTYLFDSVVAGTTLTPVAGSNAVDLGEVGSTIELIEITTEVSISRTVGDVDETAGTLDISGAAVTGQYMAAIGGGRLFKANQSGNKVTITSPAAGVFVAGDKGKLITRSDGSNSLITDYISATQVSVAESAAFADLACCINPTSGNYSRKYNDIVPDKALGEGEYSLDSRLISGSELYFPKRFFKPLPSGNIVVINNGFCIVATRDDGKFYYSGLGDRDWFLGYYDVLKQIQRIEGKVRHMLKMPDLVNIFCNGKTLVLATNNSINQGLDVAGEYIPVLRKAIVADRHIGVIAWQSIVYKRTSLLIAMTNEPAIRTFDGHSWSVQNYAVDARNGNDAVQKYYIDRIDPTNGVMAEYTRQGGYILWAYRWIYS